MNRLSLLAKRILWPGIDYGLRARFALRHRLLAGPEITTLDIGCGTGCMTVAAAQRGASALGISVDEELHRTAEVYRDALGMEAARCAFRRLGAYDLDDAKLPAFDQIILFETLEHLAQDELAIALCSRHLKPNGWLHVTVPNRHDHRVFGGLSRTEDGGHVRHGYDYPALDALLRRHGLEPIDYLGVGGWGTVLGFLAVSQALSLPGWLGRLAAVATFALLWPLVQILDLLPSRPWSHYVVATRRVA